MILKCLSQLTTSKYGWSDCSLQANVANKVRDHKGVVADPAVTGWMGIEHWTAAGWDMGQLCGSSIWILSVHQDRMKIHPENQHLCLWCYAGGRRGS